MKPKKEYTLIYNKLGRLQPMTKSEAHDKIVSENLIDLKEILNKGEPLGSKGTLKMLRESGAISN